jgi:hypothetical protein
MSCLETLVTYKKSCVGSNGAKYLIQELPAISSELAANIANGDTVSGEATVNEAIGFAAKLIQERINTMLLNYTVPSGLFDSCACVTPSSISSVQFVSKPYAFGVRIDAKTPSRFGILKLQKVRVLSNQDAAGIVVTFEEQDGTVFTKTVNLTANSFVEIPIDYQMKTPVLKIYATGLPLAAFSCYELGSGCNCNGGSKTNTYEKTQSKFFNIAKYEANTPNLLVNDNTVYGFQPCLEYQCSNEAIFCHYKDRFALPLLYFAGALLLESSLISNRLNASTIQDPDERRVIINDYYKRANAYLENAAATIEAGLKATRGDDCIVCTGNSTGWLVN